MFFCICGLVPKYRVQEVVNLLLGMGFTPPTVKRGTPMTILCSYITCCKNMWIEVPLRQKFRFYFLIFIHFGQQCLNSKNVGGSIWFNYPYHT